MALAEAIHRKLGVVAVVVVVSTHDNQPWVHMCLVKTTTIMDDDDDDDHGLSDP
jgi:hypothetical protein